MTDFFENLLNNGELQEKVAELQGKIDAYQMSENEANEIITELKALIAQRDESITAQAEIILELKADNDRLKTQYNCYACGNCKGKEDYINLEKHHIGLRKQFDKKVQTLREIKEITEQILEKGLEPQSVEYQLRLRGKEELASVILDLITKAESEG